jgi:site-specific DNA-adenine methylase
MVRAAVFLEDATILRRDFREALLEVAPGDFVFLDPPYLYGDDQRDQQAYNAQRFNSRDLLDLSNEVRRLVDMGAQVVLCWGERFESLVPRTGNWIQCGRDYCWTSFATSEQEPG